MASGISIDDDCVKCHDTIKGKKSERCYSYLIFRISDDKKSIIVCDKGEKGDTYDEFLQKLLEAEANKQNRYAVFDFHYTKVTLDTTLEKDKLMYINWNPDTSPIKEKMLYASSSSALAQKLNIKSFEQINDICDLERETMTKKVLAADHV